MSAEMPQMVLVSSEGEVATAEFIQRLPNILFPTRLPEQL